VIQRIFEPFYRSAAGGNQQGLGLGLYIAHQIAHAHGGTLEVTSTSAETRFVLKVPTPA
jgi:signal transduction histidine kinase